MNFTCQAKRTLPWISIAVALVISMSANANGCDDKLSSPILVIDSRQAISDDQLDRVVETLLGKGAQFKYYLGDSTNDSSRTLVATGSGVLSRLDEEHERSGRFINMLRFQSVEGLVADDSLEVKINRVNRKIVESKGSEVSLRLLH